MYRFWNVLNEPEIKSQVKPNIEASERPTSTFEYLLWFYIILTCIRILKIYYPALDTGNVAKRPWRGIRNIRKVKNPTKGNNDTGDLSHVIGLESVKNEINYYIDFINNKQKYIKWGVKVPKGVLLAGPPGTGKTLLVKTIANNLDIPIISMSGSEFVEIYVGVGASRVRSLFKKARGLDKCIIFIDEIDAVGSKRGFDKNSERDNTLNQILVEMDGFQETDNIIIFAATNMVAKLDTALTRSGRFDKKIYFDPPNLKERKAMYKMYLNGMSIPEELSFDILAERSAGLTGADIATICNQAKINTIQSKRVSLREQDIQDAIDEVTIGCEKLERMMTVKERERVSRHEAGHAIIGYILRDCTHPVKVSIIPRGEAALGFSQQKVSDKKIYGISYIKSQIAVCLGGRVAEQVIYGDYTTGAADDIEKITHLIYNYSCRWGMNSKIGALNPEVMGHIGDSMDKEIFAECKLIVDDIEGVVTRLLTKYKKYILAIGDSLLKNDTITYDEICNILPARLENSTYID